MRSATHYVRFFFLSKLVSEVGGLAFSGFANQGRGHQRTVHGGEQRSTKYSGDTSHVERMHKDRMFRLENKHKVEGAYADTN